MWKVHILKKEYFNIEISNKWKCHQTTTLI